MRAALLVSLVLSGLGGTSLALVLQESELERAIADPDGSGSSLDALTDWLPAVVPVDSDPPSQWLQPRGKVEAKGELYWLFGTHHKTGTHLARWLARYQSEAMSNPLGEWWPQGYCSKSFHHPGESHIWVLCHVSGSTVREVVHTAAQAGGRLRMVHFIREPISWVVSSYLYHIRQAEDWGPYHPWVNYSNMTMEEGLEQEANWLLTTEVQDMLSANVAREDDCMFVRMEDFTYSSASFNASVERLYSYTLSGVKEVNLIPNLLKQATAQDLHNELTTALQHDEMHMATKDLTRIGREAVRKIPQHLLEKLRHAGELLGYSYTSSEGRRGYRTKHKGRQRK